MIAALKRREILDDEVFEDIKKIEEMKKLNLKTNNRRDIEMDVLQTRLDSNQKLLFKTTKILLSEISEYKKNSESEFFKILRGFNEIHWMFSKEGGYIY